MQFKLTIDMDNVAFDDGSEYSNELVRLLASVTESVQMGKDFDSLRDVNGNLVGRWSISDEGVED